MSTKFRTTAHVAAAGLLAAAAGFPQHARAEDNVIQLGSAVSITGKYSQEGKDTMNGYDLGVKMINDHGGVKIHGKTYKLAVKYYDDESTAARTAQLLERLISQDGIKFALGPFASGPTKAAAPVVEKYKIPMVAPEGASRSIYSQGYKYIFAPLSTAEQYLTPAVELAAMSSKELGKKPSQMKIAMAVEQDPFSLDMRAGVLDQTKKMGMKVVLDDKLPSDLSDLSATLTKLKVLKPDVFIVAGHAKAAATATRQMKELDVNVPIVAMTLCEAANLTGKFPGASEGILCPTQWAETLKYQDKLFGTAMDFYNLYMKTYSGYKEVPYQSAQAAAAIEIYADAFRRAQSLDPKKVRDALAKTNMETFYGHIKFDSRGVNTEKPMVLRQIQNDKYEVVYPTKYAAAKFIVPRSAVK